MTLKALKTSTCVALALASLNANAASFSFTGTFSADNNVQLFNFSVGAISDVTLRSYSYAGGTQADGNIVSAGGFDPILALFDSTGALIDQNDDDATGTVAADPTTGNRWDTFLVSNLGIGDYTVAVMQYDNFAGTSLSDAFARENEPSFTSIFNCSNGSFCDASSSNRTNEWAFDVLNVDDATSVVPVPAAVWLFGSGLIGLAGVARRRNHA